MEAFAEKPSIYETERDKPMPSLNHAILQRRLVVKLDVAYGSTYEILPEINIDVIDRGRVPDIAITSLLGFNPTSDTIQLKEAPLGVIEILSPKQHLRDLVEKSVDYFKIGIKSYWLVLPELRSIYIAHQPEDFEVFTWKDVLKDDVLNIEINLKEIFK